ncbi:TetR/AcrR family transcriptional regulator [Mycobacterium sp. GA-2829]|uniref:TetR/AcrR family transcriptional regulator n=1 Tax=Mycobacterium sp. GA-2829 TaxID=1772283 RepID=UPI00073FC774|nr:TetR/AcrR family transcriptional regulator [Mycobacterium sp. GA-2829]KUI39227.1 TetR family transcriptional regulator [Mycobacterium sp. GA-2829]
MAEPAQRRLTPKGQATRDRILDAAADLIATTGLSTLTMVAIRKAASVSGSQLTHYFPDRQALLRALIERQIHAVIASQGRLETFDDLERWLGLTLRRLRESGFSGTPTYHGLAGQLAKSDAALREVLADGYRQWITVLEDGIREMRQRGLLIDDADPHQLAVVLVGAHQAGGTVAFVYRQEWPQADALRFAVNRVRRYAADPAERTPRPPRRRRRTA